MIPTNCGNCVFWKKHREMNCNWGECNGIHQLDPTGDPLEIKASIDGKLFTNEVFFCSNWTYKQQQTYTIVDAAREAAQRLKQHKT